MSYYGRIIRPETMDAGVAGRVIQRSLSALYGKGASSAASPIRSKT